MTAPELLAHLDASILRAEHFESKLGAGGDPLMEVGGFCGLKTRHLFNALCSVPGINYLEVGVLHGATLLSAAYGNDGRFVGIDSFCQDFGGTDPAATRANIAKWGHGQVTLIEEDCWTVDPMDIITTHSTPMGGRVLSFVGDPFDVLFYDGSHSRDETARAFSHFLPVMAESFLMIVDDANWPDVKAGIEDGLAEHAEELWLASDDLRDPWAPELSAFRCCGVGIENDAAGYWNGLWIGVFSR